jgi:hypothetical protein
MTILLYKIKYTLVNYPIFQQEKQSYYQFCGAGAARFLAAGAASDCINV